MKGIRELFGKAAHGIRFTGRSAIKIGEKIIQISEEQGWKKLLFMVEMLCMISESSEYEYFYPANSLQIHRI
jgi:hypothetical protein